MLRPGSQGTTEPLFQGDCESFLGSIHKAGGLAIMLPPDIGYISNLTIRPDIPAYHFPPLNPGGTAANLPTGKENCAGG